MIARIEYNGPTMSLDRENEVHEAARRVGLGVRVEHGADFLRGVRFMSFTLDGRKHPYPYADVLDGLRVALPWANSYVRGV